MLTKILPPHFFTFHFSFLLLLLLLAGCDYAAKQDLRNERDDSVYRAAMADYQAGRLDAAVTGFEKAAREDPANASVRFQLAYLLQDYKKDALGAFCAYREYLQQHPESDKAAIARTRLATCEKDVAELLAAKYGLDDADSRKLVDSLRQELKDCEKRLSVTEKELQTVRERCASLMEERDRLVNAVKSTGELEPEEQTAAVAATTVKEAKDLLDEDDDERETDAAEMAKDIASLKADEKEETESSSSLLPVQAADAKAKRDQLREARAQAKREAEEREHRRHPAEYVVQEGDTLYRLAERFYGRISAWKAIRDANKAVISTDGRLKTGTRITLPYGIK